MKISIIIPVYNAANYLEQCLDSVLNQNLAIYEVICVNDGSKDHSWEILEQYAQKDTRVKLYNQQNGGVSSARNLGLQHANGDYVGFVDADDFILPNYYKSFLTELQSDIIALQPNERWGPVHQKMSKYEMTSSLMLNMLATDDFNSVCFKIFKLEKIQQHSIKFPLGMRLGEDAHFVFSCLQHAQSVVLVPNQNGYIYRENFESATKSAVKDNSVFDRVFSEFQFDHKSKFNIQLSEEQILNAKLQKFNNSYLSALSIYLRSNPIMSKSSRWQLVKTSMVQFKTIYESTKHLPIWELPRGRFERLVLIALQKQRFGLIKLLFAYSHWRNGIK